MQRAAASVLMKPSVRLSTLILSLVSMSAGATADVDLHHIVRLVGHGPRTVILEAGLGDTLDVWKDVQPRIAAGCTRSDKSSGSAGSRRRTSIAVASAID